MPIQLGFDRPVRVLLIDDDQDDYLITRDLLAEIPAGDYQLAWSPDYEAGLEAFCKNEHDVVLLDYRLGVRTGLELLAEAHARNCVLPVILLTGQGEREIDLAAMRVGAADYLEKSRLDPTLLERSIRYACLQKQYEAALEKKVRERTSELEATNQALQREIADRKRAEEALKDAARRKDEFLATLAHELRNPLAPVRNALEIIRLAGNSPRSVEQARSMMERQVNQMVRLIDDLLDVSRITRGKLRLERDNIALQSVIDIALDSSRPLIEQAGLTLRVALPDIPIVLHADRVRLAQVFSNLLNNASKFTERGGSVALMAEQKDGQVTVRVRDTGIGIPVEKLPQVFDLFTQVNRSLNRDQGGLGIGLALVRQLVEMHGGTVEAHSEGVGRGSEFVVCLPVARA